MAKDITVNFLGEDVTIKLPDLNSFDEGGYSVDLSQGLSLHYGVKYSSVNDDSRFDISAIITNKDGEELNGHESWGAPALIFDKTVERLTENVVKVTDRQIRNDLKEAQRILDTYADIKIHTAPSVKGPEM